MVMVSTVLSTHHPASEGSDLRAWSEQQLMQALRLEEEPRLENPSNANGEKLFGVVHTEPLLRR
jgi:hypothetical protein